VILVTGATGTVGREVVAQLLVAGEKVRALTRNPSRAHLDEQVELVAGDFNQPETLAKAVEGVESIFSLAFGPQLAIQEASLAQAGQKAGAQHIVKLSALRPGGEARSTIATWHLASERAIQNMGIAWTFVQPGAFMSNALNWRDTIKSQGKVFSNYGDGKVAYIHPRDIAAVAVHALTEPGHEGKTYQVTGPEALSVGEVVQLLSEAVGKPIEYVPITDDATREGMQKAGLPAFLIDALLPYASFVRTGKGAEILPTVEEVIGRKPLTFADWAREHATDFR
jgi:(4-alkanoyl-5-oxo-2,5-dihydrofuran-3-yl)methyl phosphate reductase